MLIDAVIMCDVAHGDFEKIIDISAHAVTFNYLRDAANALCK
jgi:hypothetical protein